ncbi:alpha/beta fold hydrolase [bacterium]|nr:alpha/beta fold hydrolase [candidate division CSSED10-310 bacterium]
MFITVNNARIYYEIAGTGKNVLTMHGGPGIGDHGDHKKMFQTMEDRFRFVYYDQRGNGQSEHCDPSTYTHDQNVEDAEALRKALDLGPVALSGGSYGGILALEYALKYPAGLKCMILRGTAASYELQDAAFTNALNSNLPGVTREILEDLFYGRMKSNDDLRDKFSMIYPLYSTTYNPEKLTKMLARKEFYAATHNAFFTTAFPNYDIRGRLSEIRTPTLILAGRHDWITPMKFARELADNMPNAYLEIFEQSGHSIHSDEPDKFYRVTEEFLNSYA